MTAAPAPAETPPSLYDRIGGMDGVRLVVDRFYDLMEHEPSYAPLRAMHEADLMPTRVSLTQFLTAWLGGPRDWFVARPGACIMSMHRAMPITRDTAAQWVHAMSRALVENRVEPALGAQMQQSFLRMANAMIPRVEEAQA